MKNHKNNVGTFLFESLVDDYVTLKLRLSYVFEDDIYVSLKQSDTNEISISSDCDGVELFELTGVLRKNIPTDEYVLRVSSIVSDLDAFLVSDTIVTPNIIRLLRKAIKGDLGYDKLHYELNKESDILNLFSIVNTYQYFLNDGLVGTSLLLEELYGQLTSNYNMKSYDIQDNTLKEWYHFFKTYNITVDASGQCIIKNKKGTYYKELTPQKSKIVYGILKYLHSRGYTTLLRMDTFCKDNSIHFKVGKSLNKSDESVVDIRDIIPYDVLPKEHWYYLEEFVGKYIKRSHTSYVYNNIYNYSSMYIKDMLDYISKQDYAIVTQGLLIEKNLDGIIMFRESKKETTIDTSSDVGSDVGSNTSSDNNVKDDMLKDSISREDLMYIKITLLTCLSKGYKTLEVTDSSVLVAKQEYTEEQLNTHSVKRKTFVDLQSAFMLIGLRGYLNKGVYAIRDVVNLPREGEILTVNGVPHHFCRIDIEDGQVKYKFYPNQYNKEMYEVMGGELESVSSIDRKCDTDVFNGVLRESWLRFIGRL